MQYVCRHAHVPGVFGCRQPYSLWKDSVGFSWAFARRLPVQDHIIGVSNMQKGLLQTRKLLDLSWIGKVPFSQSTAKTKSLHEEMSREILKVQAADFSDTAMGNLLRLITGNKAGVQDLECLFFEWQCQTDSLCMIIYDHA